MSEFLIVESGSTSVDWVLSESRDSEPVRWTSPGLNPYHQSGTAVPAEVQERLADVSVAYPSLRYVFFYGAGVTGPEMAKNLSEVFRSLFPMANIEFHSDLLAAARGTLGTASGIACILGTGSNSGIYDGKTIVENVSAGGYILGDEGSGSYLGRRLLGDFLKREIPEPLRTIFADQYRLDTLTILENVYRKPLANRYMASFAPFLREQIHEPYAQELVREGFTAFFRRNVAKYADFAKYTVHVIGSVAAAFRDILTQVATNEGITIGSIARSPMDGLLRYHRDTVPTDEAETNTAKVAGDRKTSENSEIAAKIANTANTTGTTNTINTMSVRITESTSRYDHLESMSVREILAGISAEDHGVAAAVARCIPAVEQLVEATVDRMRRGGRLFYIGAGTSGRLGILDASEIPPTYGMAYDRVIGLMAGGDDAIRRAVEGAEDDPNGAVVDLAKFEIGPEDVLVGIAASGTTPYVVGGLRTMRERGILTACVTCNPGSPVTQAAQIPIVAVVGPEFVTGSTRMKSGTAQKLILNMISSTVMIRLGHVKGNRMVDMRLANAKLVDRGTRMVMEATGLDYVAAKERLQNAGNVRDAIRRGNSTAETPANADLTGKRES